MLLNEYVCQSSHNLPISFLSNFTLFKNPRISIQKMHLSMGLGNLHFQSAYANRFWFDNNPQEGTYSWWSAFFPTEGFKAAFFLEFPLFPVTEFRGSCRNTHRYRISVTFLSTLTSIFCSSHIIRHMPKGTDGSWDTHEGPSNPTALGLKSRSACYEINKGWASNKLWDVGRGQRKVTQGLTGITVIQLSLFLFYSFSLNPPNLIWFC